jgi:hypothetical protein
LRALIPLTVAPTTDDETAAVTPPIMAVLDERPFAHGGLADRIAAEIRTGLGYELPTGETLLVRDARKEIGPDPRLTYTPIPEDVAQAVTLKNDGPVGLTFDSENVRAAVFANTALVLNPMLLTPPTLPTSRLAMTSLGPPPASMEEYFLSVGLRRYLDPAWLTAEAVNDYAIKNTLWITWRTASGGFRLGVEGTEQSRELISVEERGNVWTVCFDAAMIDPLPQQDASASPPIASPSLSPLPNFKELCTMYAGAIGGLAFLHLPLEKGRASLSVFALPSGTVASLGDAAILAGAGNQPLMMGSIEWQVPDGSTRLWFDQTAATLTSASPTTLMNWTRTGRNFELWHATKGGDFTGYGASQLVARWTAKPNCKFFEARDVGNANPLSFEPRSSRYPNPLYVHRHHAVIATRNAGGIGRPVEVFTGVRRIFGGAFSPPDDTEAVRLVEFETPARPLASLPDRRAKDALSEFQTAHFDLVSIWGKPDDDSGLSLFIRPLGGYVTNTALTSLAFHLYIRLSSQATIDKKVTIALRAGATLPVRGILLTFPHIDDDPTGQIYYVGGGVDNNPRVRADPEVPEPAVAKDETAAVELRSLTISGGRSPPTEFWTDVSLLKLPPSTKAPDYFTFDWFFTGDLPAPADAIKVAALREMIEAQARIIAVSPPIPVEG